MTDREINVAVAEACGWTWDDDRVYNPSGGYWSRWMTVSKLTGQDTLLDRIPSYCNDLNAMHEAEKIIPEDGRSIYVMCLLGDVPEETLDLDGALSEWLLATRTARQRAEAFLRTLGKWREA